MPAANLPEIVAEVRAVFERYERALVTKDLSVMAELFSDSPEVVRFGIADQERGPEELAQWRAAQPPHRPGRTLVNVTVATYGTTTAVVTTVFTYPGRPLVGRQSQTWIRGEDGWRIVHAHVSEISR
ncbi:MAG TPA: AtzH-like domain-containing protein [Acidimicrobiales bacterium]|nr:AtzH-like domain-containing protein [Acidimicrobiales bacterium]